MNGTSQAIDAMWDPLIEKIVRQRTVLSLNACLSLPLFLFVAGTQGSGEGGREGVSEGSVLERGEDLLEYGGSRGLLLGPDLALSEPLSEQDLDPFDNFDLVALASFLVLQSHLLEKRGEARPINQLDNHQPGWLTALEVRSREGEVGCGWHSTDYDVHFAS